MKRAARFSFGGHQQNQQAFCFLIGLMWFRFLSLGGRSHGGVSGLVAVHGFSVVSSRPFVVTRRLKMSDISTDGQGRRIRRRSQSENKYDGGDDDDEKDKNNEWLDVDNWYKEKKTAPSARTTSSSSDSGAGGWDDWDPLAAPNPRPQERSPRNQENRNVRSRRDGAWSSSSNYRRGGGGGGGGDTYNKNYNNNNSDRPARQPFGKGVRGSSSSDDAAEKERRINLKALEGAGYDHLYGLAPVRNALQAQRREFVPLENRLLLNQDDDNNGNDYIKAAAADDRKPEAQFRPYLFLQERKGKTGRSADKSSQADEVQRLAHACNLPIAYVDKGVLNTLSGDRPHQGCVLRCGKLDFEPISHIPNEPDSPRLWLVLDQIVDPQNLGALLRSAYFFGKIAVLVCAKNSAPPSPTVSASSAGALEDMTVYATNNLPRTLSAAEQDGFRIIGASASAPPDSDVPIYDLDKLPARNQGFGDENAPTLLVLGSEGHGIRSLVASLCTEFVKIPAGANVERNVDSLNVSVTGGILMWHLVQKLYATSQDKA